MDLGDLIIDVNAVLTSGGGSLSERQLLSDYRGLLGSTIPFRELGHSSLRSLLLSLGCFNVSSRGGETFISAQHNEQMSHISSLIARQKKKPGEKKSRGRKSSAYIRPKLPPRLNRLEVRYPPLQRTIFSSTSRVARTPPPPRYGNPPIMPQRQPLPSVQRRLETPQEESRVQRRLETPQEESRVQRRLETPQEESRVPAASAQSRLDRATVLNKQEAETRILSGVVNMSPDHNKKDSVAESLDDATFIDIQWLQGKISKPSDSKRAESVKSSTPGTSSGTSSRKSSGTSPGTSSATSSAQAPSPKPVVPLMDLKMGSVHNGKQAPSPKPVVPLMDLKIGSVHNGKQAPSPKPVAPLMHPKMGSVHNGKQAPSSKPVAKDPGEKSSFIYQLHALAIQLGLGEPSYKFIERRPSGCKPVFVAKVKLGEGGMFSSYPEEKPTQEEAQELVSKVACCELRKRRISNKQAVSESVSDSQIVERISDIVRLKTNGMFDQAVIGAYEDTFKTSLPSSWLEIIQQSPKFCIEKYNDSKAIIYPVQDTCSVNSNVERPADASPPPEPLDAAPAPSTPVVATVSPTEVAAPPLSNGHSSTHDSLKEKLCKDINANTVSIGEPRKLPGLMLPSEPTWDVYVASVGGPDVWVRLIGEKYDSVYNEVINDLEIEMLSTSGQPVTDPLIEELYCAKFDNCWLRVQLKEVIDEDDCVVFLVDNGEEDTIPVSELRVLDEAYLNLPAQAIQCRLSYVDVTYEAAQSYLMTQVIGSSFVAEVVQFPCEENNVASIVLHNTEVEGVAINMNHCVLAEICKSLEKPQLPQRHVAFVRITHVEKETPPFVQIKGRDLTFLEDILKEIYLRQDLVELYGVNAHPRMMNINENQMYLVQSSSDPETWRRGIIVNIVEDSRNPRVYFVDYGHHENVMLSDIFDIDKVMPPLKKFPPQAIQVNIANLPASQLNMGVVQRLRELVPEDVFVLGKVVNPVGGPQPDVEFFKRVQPDNMIASINADLLFHYDECSKKPINEEHKTDQTSSPQRGSIGSTSPLKSYSAPSVGSGFFDVFVSMSSNPFNFVVQPVKELNSSFNLMMKEMQDLYEAQYTVMPVPLMEDLQENCAFAVKHPEDGQWYRVAIVAAMNDSIISVRYSDFGDVGIVSMENLRFLDLKFKRIPSLAIRAKLHGIKPKNMDWSVDDCVHFNKLVANKGFVSKVLGVNNESNFSAWQVSLQLIDTTKENVDIDVAADLIKDGIADKMD